MIGDIIFLVVMWSVAVFMANRLYVIIRYREINIKGIVYSLTDTPIMYWIQMALIALGLLFIGGIAVIMSLYDAGLLS